MSGVVYSPQEKAFTFYSDAHKVYSRLGYFFMLKYDVSMVIKCEKNDPYRSLTMQNEGKAYGG